MKFVPPGFILLFITQLLPAQDKEAYVRQYRDIAITEMHRSGIPASIKLSQAILESNYGRSELARQAHNHFGIKCGNDWAGRGYHLKDDDRDARGQLVNSCFRVFGSPEESFVAHSEFLMDPRKSHRYGALFQLDSKDYKGWAHGLSKGGYATNPEYARLLIRIIEEQRLYEYDTYSVPEPLVDAGPGTKRRDDVYMAPPQPGRLHYAIRYQNDIPYVTAMAGDQVHSLAKHTDVPAKRLLRYNELEGNKRTQLSEGDRIYLQHLKKKYRGDERYHVVNEGETVAVIAHFYGVKSQSLRKRNHIPDDCEPAPGTRLSLREKSKSPVRCYDPKAPQSKIAKTPSAPQSPVQETTSVTAAVVREEEDRVVASYEEQVLQRIYTVQPKDTLYQIARMHGISVADLKTLNGLQQDTIHPGQTLKVR